MLTNAALTELQEGWGNADFAAPRPFLHELMRQVELTDGPIFECGSGLTTLVLDAILTGEDREVHVFEHEYYWMQKLIAFMQHNANIWPHLCDMTYANTAPWYDIHRLKLPKHAGLIVVDGPPGGAREGYVDALRHVIDQNTVILCDDAERDWGNIEQARNRLHASIDFLPGGRGIAIIRNCEINANG